MLLCRGGAAPHQTMPSRRGGGSGPSQLWHVATAASAALSLVRSLSRSPVPGRACTVVAQVQGSWSLGERRQSRQSQCTPVSEQPTQGVMPPCPILDSILACCSSDLQQLAPAMFGGLATPPIGGPILVT
ncbi:hypothetical protein NDU88_002935 [Pleurodeles waltl]|uniref:Uncharacterized protein n=1 Tax=Pleurodeles waltl TaxID=8319 RepID=A0AAV7T3J0_PLEWA|nr:hypothetical protein NDU88_002935 [Pleurodeles waltl]